MKLIDRIPVLGRLIKEDKGQALVFTAVVLTAFVGVTGVAVDAGKGYYAFEMLEASTNAAALAGAAGLPDTTTAHNYAMAYGSMTSQHNANGVLTNVVTIPTPGCNGTVTTSFYAPCENAAGTGTGGSLVNEIQVQQTATVPTWIGPLFGMPTFSIQDTATASMKGGTATPYNIAIVLDTTASMTGGDDGKNNGVNGQTCSSQIACAELGIQDFLLMLVPGSTSAPVDLVSLYVFPGATNLSVDYACSGTNPSSVPYTFTSASAGATTSSLPSGDSYNVIAWSSDYKAGATSTTLSSTSNIVKAVGGVSGCAGAAAPGGEGTYYAQVIYVAQADLAAESAKNGNANMMIILSDGDATACNTQTTGGSGCSKNQIEVSTCPTITTANDTKSSVISSTTPCLSPYTGLPINGTSATVSINSKNVSIQPSGYQSVTYPSALGLCGQAVQAAQFASSQGTAVYTLGYGSEITGSCATDTPTTTSGNYPSYGANPYPDTSVPSGGNSYSACYALGAMASLPANFFSDAYHNCTATDPNNAGLTSLQQQFTAIGAHLTSARLIPNTYFTALSS